MYNSLHLLVPNSLNSCLFIYFIFGCVGSSLLHMAFSSCSEQGLFLVEVHRLLVVMASFVVEHGL